MKQKLDIEIILQSIEGESVMRNAMREGSKKNLRSTIEMIKSQSADNRDLMAREIGEGILKHIEKNY